MPPTNDLPFSAVALGAFVLIVASFIIKGIGLRCMRILSKWRKSV